MEIYNKRSGYVLALTIIVGTFLYVRMGYFSKYMIERYCEKVLGTNVSIGYMKIDAVNSLITVKDLEIDNPKEYRKISPHAVTIDNISIKTEALLKGQIKFGDIKVAGTKVYLVADEKGSNFAVFKDNIINYRHNYMTTYKEGDYEAPYISVKDIELSDAALYPTITSVNTKIDPISISDFHMEDIGEGIEGGIRISHAIAMVWHDLTNAAIDASAGKGLFSNLPNYQMQRIKNTTDLNDEIKNMSDDEAKSLFGRRR